MALSIKDPETERLARALAARTGESVTKAIRESLRERLRQFGGEGGQTNDVMADLTAIVGRYRQRPVVDDRSADEIISYDLHGLPI
jgi:antitoxin VapB